MGESRPIPERPKIAGLLLAGGLSRRMGGGDKTLRQIGGRPILDRVIERLRPQVDFMVLNANGDPERFGTYGLPVVADSAPDFAGPLAGISAGLDWVAENRPDCTFILSAATDAPFLPLDLLNRLLAALTEQKADLACAASGGQSHPVFGLWPVRLRAELRRAVMEEGVRKVDRWTERYRLATVAFPDKPIDPFFNANRPEDLENAAALLAQGN